MRPDPSTKPMRVLVTGAGGLLGGRLAALLAQEMEVVAGIARSPAPEGLATARLDLLDPSSLGAALALLRPDAVLHSAALSEPDRCEADPDAATRLNADAPAVLARQCARAGVRFVHLSTDLVFPGDRAGSVETDPPAPILHYGHTKLAGERAVQMEDPGAAIARVTLVIGRGHGPRGTGSESIAWALAEGRRVRLYSDQYRTPIDAVSVASACSALLRGTHAGLFHLGGAERVSRHQIALRVAALLGLDASLIDEARQREHPPSVPRPLDVSLDSSRARRELGWAPRPLDEALRDGRARPPL
jgi:dTDP-4-dehydrorhamnose reductase